MALATPLEKMATLVALDLVPIIPMDYSFHFMLGNWIVRPGFMEIQAVSIQFPQPIPGHLI